MFINNYYTKNENVISYTRQQGNDFAKDVADDFNPIHDITAKRFCIPGDLLFATVLHQYGLSQKMRFDFLGLVTEDVKLRFPQSPTNDLVISGENNKDYLKIVREGEATDNRAQIETLIRQYVAFSGNTFPHILVPLMKSNNVMINPDRPLVMYQSMLIDFNSFGFDDLTLEMAATDLQVNGKRGSASLSFSLLSDGKVIGTGMKNMVLSGLRPYDAAKIAILSETYNSHKVNYFNNSNQSFPLTA